MQILAAQWKLIFLIFFVGIQAYAADPSCDTVWWGPPTKSQGPVRVTRSEQVGGHATRLDISYAGPLSSSQSLAVLVMVHYPDGDRQQLVPMTAVGRGGNFEITISSDSEKWLLSEASGALSFELAFVNSEGMWDNNGQPYRNYKFQF